VGVAEASGDAAGEFDQTASVPPLLAPCWDHVTSKPRDVRLSASALRRQLGRSGRVGAPRYPRTRSTSRRPRLDVSAFGSPLLVFFSGQRAPGKFFVSDPRRHLWRPPLRQLVVGSGADLVTATSRPNVHRAAPAPASQDPGRLGLLGGTPVKR
jgi:hypothetical protein